jgi:hypothetical protein
MDLEIFESGLPIEKYVEGYITSAFTRKNFGIKFKIDKLEIIIIDLPVKYINFINDFCSDDKLKPFLSFSCSIYSINNSLCKPILAFDKLDDYLDYLNNDLFNSKPLYNICKNCYLKFNEILRNITKEVLSKNFF